MKLLALGATGGIGVEIVKQGLERGHSVTALVRKVTVLTTHPGLPGAGEASATLRIQISRADVADFMIKSAEDGSHIRKIAGLCD